MEIVLIALGTVALAGLASTTLRVRASRRTVRRSGAAQWRGSAASARRTERARPAAAAAPLSVVSVGATVVRDPPRTRIEEDAWDDDLEWSNDLDATPVIAVRDEPARATPTPRGTAGAIAARARPGLEEREDDAHGAAELAPAPIVPEIAAAPAARPAPDPEPAWDDDLLQAHADAPRHAVPAVRGAAAFGAATATPPATRRRENPLRSPVALVALYALAGIGLVVLAVSLLADGVSPTKPAPARRASAAKPAPTPATPARAPAGSSKDAEAARRQKLQFQRAVGNAIAAERQALRDSRAARRARLAARRRAADRRRAARARARRSVATPGRSATPSYTAPAPSQAPASPSPTSGGSGGSGGSAGSGGSGGGGGGCEFCIG